MVVKEQGSKWLGEPAKRQARNRVPVLRSEEKAQDRLIGFVRSDNINPGTSEGVSGKQEGSARALSFCCAACVCKSAVFVLS